MPLLNWRRSLSLAVMATTFAAALENSARMVPDRSSSGTVIHKASRVFASRWRFPEMPCTEGGLPVTMDILLGQVKLGMAPSAMAANP